MMMFDPIPNRRVSSWQHDTKRRKYMINMAENGTYTATVVRKSKNGLPTGDVEDVMRYAPTMLAAVKACQAHHSAAMYRAAEEMQEAMRG